MTRAVRIVGSVACLAAAAVALLLAVDVRAWQGRVTADDVRFRTDPARRDLWRPGQIVPFGSARRLLALDDDLEYRQALRLYQLARPLEPRFDPESAADRVDAQLALTAAAHDLPDGLRRAQVTNLLGVLQTALASGDPRAAQTFMESAVSSFVHAIELDARDDAPKFNLEFALNQLRGEDEQQTRGRGRQGQRGQAGLNELGRGY